MWIAKIEFFFRGQKFKKGDEVRVSTSLAKSLEAEGKIALKTKESKEKE